MTASKSESAVEEGPTAIVLAGGEGKRIGMPKAFLTLQGRPMIDRIVDRLRPVCDEMIIVVSASIGRPIARCEDTGGGGSPSRFATWVWPAGTVVLNDRVQGKGPLGGIATGLAAASRPWAFVVSCDAPFVSSRLVHLLAHHSEGADAVVPMAGGRPQPLHALYRREARLTAQRRIDADQLRMMDFLKDRSLRVYTVEESEWMSWGIHPITFTNVNRAGDVIDAEHWMSDPKNIDLLEE